jgi:hypothetical protein
MKHNPKSIPSLKGVKGTKFSTSTNINPYATKKPKTAIFTKTSTLFKKADCRTPTKFKAVNPKHNSAAMTLAGKPGTAALR